MRFAYADPPYPGMSHLYRDHPDYAGEVDHAALIARLVAEFPDGWALSTAVPALRTLLPICPPDVEILAWCKRYRQSLTRSHIRFQWEPVLLCGGRNRVRQDAIFNFLVTSDPNNAIRFIGSKPLDFCFWIFRCLGALPGDELVDLFPGSGAVTRAWDKYQRQVALPLGGEREKQARMIG